MSHVVKIEFFDFLIFFSIKMILDSLSVSPFPDLKELISRNRCKTPYTC